MAAPSSPSGSRATATTLGNLITRHLAEFDRTVKTYGGEMVERLGERTQDISGAMRDYLDNFDTRVTVKSAEVTASLDQQLARFRNSLDGRTQVLNDAFAARMLEVAKAMAAGARKWSRRSTGASAMSPE